MTNAKRDRQTHKEPVLDELEGLIDEMLGRYGRSRKWQHDDVHECVNQGTVNEAAYDGAANQEGEFAAGQIVDRRCTESDEEMQDDAQRGRLCPTAKRLQAKNAAGNELRNDNGLARTVHGNRVSEIQYANNQAAKNDGRKRPRSWGE